MKVTVRFFRKKNVWADDWERLHIQPITQWWSVWFSHRCWIQFLARNVRVENVKILKIKKSHLKMWKKPGHETGGWLYGSKFDRPISVQLGRKNQFRIKQQYFFTVLLFAYIFIIFAVIIIFKIGYRLAEKEMRSAAIPSRQISSAGSNLVKSTTNLAKSTVRMRFF